VIREEWIEVDQQGAIGGMKVSDAEISQLLEFKKEAENVPLSFRGNVLSEAYEDR
jgi:hypothetical protein